jgi:hypothetical protein
MNQTDTFAPLDQEFILKIGLAKTVIFYNGVQLIELQNSHHARIPASAWGPGFSCLCHCWYINKQENL